MSKGPKIVNVFLAVLSLLGALALGYGPAARRGDISPASGRPIVAAALPHDLAAPHLTYVLEGGYVHNWLVAGPQAVPTAAPTSGSGMRARRVLAREHYDPTPGIAGQPMENGSSTAGDTELTWRYYRTLDDHYVDLSSTYPRDHYLRTWAYTQIDVSASQQVRFALTTDGPADVWLNGQHVHQHRQFAEAAPQHTFFEGELAQGRNEVLVRFEQLAELETPYAMALQMLAQSEGNAPRALSAEVVLPTAIENATRRQMLEQLFEQAYVERPVYHKGNTIMLRWADDLEARSQYMFQVQDDRHRIYLEGQGTTDPSEQVNVGHYARFWERDYWVSLLPLPREYYELGMRYQRDLPIQVVDNEHSSTPYGTHAERRVEALEDAARREDGLYAEIAKMELGRWNTIDAARIVESIDEAHLGQAHSEADIVGLLGALYHYADNPGFPEGLAREIDTVLPDARCWDDAVHSEGIATYAVQILAGQRYRERTLGNTGWTGRRHREEGERRALDWLRERARSGFDAWDSNLAFETYAVALAHLADLAEHPGIRELAVTGMDKMMLSLALNSYKGVFGSTHGYSETPMVVSGRLEATSGISRLMWGMGTYNRHVRGTVSLACSGYMLPPAIAEVATDLSDELWSRERHTSGDGSGWLGGARRREVNKVTYRTPDYMLSSAQDYRPGAAGNREHIWQATLGPDAVVFANHPANSGENDARGPGFWLGNGVLPRVAQWKDTLIATYRLPEDDWMGFTHAYLPVHAFDEFVMRGGWAFARLGSGYLALTAAQGIELATRGPSAYRELRSYGTENTWLCMMGREATDGSFQSFQDAVLALDVELEALSARTATLRGETLSFGWRAPLRVDGKVQRITGFRHYDSPYLVADAGQSVAEGLNAGTASRTAKAAPGD